MMLRTKIVYAYDPFTYELLGLTEASESPAEVGQEPPVYLYPAHTTDIIPPSDYLPEFKAWYFDLPNQQWIMITDYRGQTIHNELLNQEKTQDKLGELEEGWILGSLPIKPPDPPPTFTITIDNINQELDHLNDPATASVLIGTWPADNETIQTMNDEAAYIVRPPAFISFSDKTMIKIMPQADGTLVNLSMKNYIDLLNFLYELYLA
jgi:hypothetical protein